MIDSDNNERRAFLVIRKLVDASASVNEFEALAWLLKAAGLNQAQVVAVFENARKQVPNDLVDDAILEALDFITGFCQSHKRIFDTQL